MNGPSALRKKFRWAIVGALVGDCFGKKFLGREISLREMFLEFENLGADTVPSISKIILVNYMLVRLCTVRYLQLNNII